MNPLDRLVALRKKDRRVVLGLSSGTSADGVDAAVVQIRGNGTTLSVGRVFGRTYEYGDALRRALTSLNAADAAEICRMNFSLGHFFAKCAGRVAKEAGLSLDQVDLIGSHGQTICHVPHGEGGDSSTLQIGEPDVIAEKTRVPVIADFRTRDVAAGGEGAPLLPYVDYLLFRGRAPVALQNIGGIANVTVVTENLAEVIAFDNGPGNMPLDSLTRILTRGEEAFDHEGKRAARGRVIEDLLAILLDHPFLRRRPPKSTGREQFGKPWVLEVLERKGNAGVADVLATMTLFVARAIHRSYEDFVWPRTTVNVILVSGGGARNTTLMAHLRRLFLPLPVRGLEETGFDPDLKEAVAFAVLANETLFGNPNNVPAATGADWPTVLGKICP